LFKEGVCVVNNKLCLGTVQFGLNYGINNPSGKPARESVFAMLDEALEKGIDCIDTAFAYGNAEELLGEYGIGKIKNLKIISKLRPNLITDKCNNPEEIIEEQVRGSLDRVGLSVLDGYLLHTPENFYNSGIINGLQRCKEKGLIKHLGVSVYETEHALDVVSSDIVDYIQVPYSVFDQRLDQTDFFKIAKENNVTVFLRSAFLQGLILMEENKIPDHLLIAKDYLRQFDSIIGKYGFSRLQAAFLFSYMCPKADYLVFGVDTMNQLQEDIQMSRIAFDFQTCREELSANFRNISKSIIFPSLWKKG
jgi:aryl-alcohol dehydrogenase-like predicted oxidoreductase